MSSQRLVTLSLILFALAIPAHALTALGSITLPAPPAMARASSDGSKLVVILGAAPAAPVTLMVLDTRNPQSPQPLGSLSLPAADEIALSGDGRLALVHTKRQPDKFNAETARTIFAIDVADARTPRILWEQPLLAGDVALSSQANAFAYTRLAADGSSKWEAVVVSTLDRRTQATMPIGSHGHGGIALSPSANLLAQTQHGFFRIWAVPSGTPRNVEPVESYAPERLVPFQCRPIALDSGHFVVLDGRVSRLGVYKAIQGLPRVAALSAEDFSPCIALNPNNGTSSFDFNDLYGQVTRIDLSNSRRPARQGQWQLPPLVYPLATARDLLYSARSHNRLQIFRLDAAAGAPVDGPALHAAHRAALEGLSAGNKPGGSDYMAKWNAARTLEEAGVLLALAAPISGIADRSAAAILNDYGYLASETGRPARIAQAALRKAISLDPTRAVAHLNLGDLLRKDLATFAATGGDVSGRVKEIELHYRAYFANGGRPNAAVSIFLRGDPAAGAKDDCAAIAAWANAGRFNELLSDVGINLNWGGRRIDLIAKTEGSANVPAIVAFDARDDRPLTEGDPLGLEPYTSGMWGGDSLGILSLRGRHYIVYHRGHPIWAIWGDRQSCHFDFAAVETVSPQAQEAELCVALQSGEPIADLSFDGEWTIEPETLQETHPQTSIVGTRELDFSNDGTPLTVAHLELASGAGAGCDQKLYDLFDADGGQIVKGPLRDRLLELQSAGQCGNQARFFEYRGAIYFETKPSRWPPTDKWSQYHAVTTVRGGRVVDVCNFKFASTVTAR